MKRFIVTLFPLVVLGTLIGWRLHTKNQDAATEKTQREARLKAPPVVSVAPAEVRDIVHTFEATGTLEAPLNVKIAPKITGRIDYLTAHEGDPVTEGEVLARINPYEIEAQVSQRRATLLEAQSRLAQAQLTQGPADASVNTQIQLQQATLDSAKADLEQARQNSRSLKAAFGAGITDAQGRLSTAEAGINRVKATIRSAEANLENAKAKYNRVLNLYNKGFIAGQDVDDARTQVNVQQSAVDEAKSQLDAAIAERDAAAAQKVSAQTQYDAGLAKGKAAIDAAIAKVVQMEASLRYANANIAQKPAYRQNLAALRSAVTAAAADLKNMEAQLAETILRSPLSGYVTARLMDPGSVATPGQPILSVEAIRQVWATVPVPEEVRRKITSGQTAKVKIDALPGRLFTGKIVQINASADPQGRQFTVRVLLDNARNALKPGMYARVFLETERVPAALCVPHEAVQQDQNGSSVIIVNAAGTVAHRRVTTGASDTRFLAITQGLQPGEKVVVLSAVPLKDGQTVRADEKR